jgi:hypothetical protein
LTVTLESVHRNYLVEVAYTSLLVKENPWPYVNLAKLVQNAKIGEGEVLELLKIANGYLPRVRLEYNRLKGKEFIGS